MSIFKNIYFLNEGEQAEDYKARKQKEKEEAEKADKERFDRRYGQQADRLHTAKKMGIDSGVGDKITWQYHKNGNHPISKYTYDKGKEDSARREKSEEGASKEVKNAPGSDSIYTRDRREGVRKLGIMDKVDAKNRHIRRHPDQYKESGLFECVEFIND